MRNHKSKGFILISALIFLLLLSLLAYQALESALLEIKLHQTVERQRFLFEKAQDGLKKAEKSLRTNCKQTNKYICVTVEELENKNPQEYKITAQASEGDMSVTLQSTCVKAKTEKTCEKRLSWAQLSD
jgi:Tfp pilus assembly protein PilX